MSGSAPEFDGSIVRPTALIVRTAGTNCEAELSRAFELAGATPKLVHLDTLCLDPSPLLEANLIGFPGGFSYGDDVASGRIFAMRVREALADPIRAAVDRGACVIGVCNGFQVLVQAGVLPGREFGGQTAALVENQQGRFLDDWVAVEPSDTTHCVWTRGLALGSSDAMRLPVANGEGRFVVDPETLARLESAGQIALRYTDDVNGSVGRVAGICDATGRVFGLMPHPERYLDWNRHPYWTRLTASDRSGVTPGLRMFINAVGSVSMASIESTA